MVCMENRGKSRDFEAEIFDSVTKKSITHIYSSTDVLDEPYEVGGYITLGDSVLYKNNSQRARKCRILNVEKLSESTYNLFITPTNQEVPSVKVNLEQLVKAKQEDETIRFKFDIYDLKDNRFLATSGLRFENSERKEPHKIGDVIPLPDCFIHDNNCRKLRKCIIQRITPVEKEPNKYILHVEVTNDEYRLGIDTNLNED